jgi:hypothetical protein
MRALRSTDVKSRGSIASAIAIKLFLFVSWYEKDDQAGEGPNIDIPAIRFGISAAHGSTSLSWRSIQA